MTGATRPDCRPLPACPAGTQDLKLVKPSSTQPLPCPACLAGSQASQRCSCFIVQNFPFRLDKPTGAASCSFSLSNYKSSARARQAGTGRDQLSPKKIFARLLFVAHSRLCLTDLAASNVRQAEPDLRGCGTTIEGFAPKVHS